MSPDTSRALIFCAVFAAYVLSGGLSVPSEDFNAIWMAGKSFAAGQFDQIYPVTDGVFALQSPESWNAQLVAEGAAGAIYPFIYPPLWAWVAQVLPATTTLQTAVSVFFLINTFALMVLAWLAWRMAGRALPLSLYIAIALAIFAFTSAGRTALGNNQPQILLSLVIVASLERLTAGRALSAGSLMALGASLKGVPVLYALLWIANGRWRALAAFGVVGAALGGLSIAVAGWPLHERFLDLLSDIRGTLFILWLNLSLDGIIGNLFFGSQTIISDLAVVGEESVRVRIAAPKPEVIALISTALMLITLAGSALLLRSKPDDPLVWPLVLIGISFVSPLAWSYHYLASIAFLPCLLARLGTRAGLIWIAVIMTPALPFLGNIARENAHLTVPYHFVMTLTIPLMATAFALAIRRGPPKT